MMTTWLRVLSLTVLVALVWSDTCTIGHKSFPKNPCSGSGQARRDVWHAAFDDPEHDPACVQFEGEFYCSGYVQKSSNNKDAVIVKYAKDPKDDWCHDNYEESGADGEAEGVFINIHTPEKRLYGVFKIDGAGQGPDFTRYTKNGWQKSPGWVSGAKMMQVIIELDKATGDAMEGRGTYIGALLSSGKGNSVPTTAGVAFVASEANPDECGGKGVKGCIVVGVNSAFSPKTTAGKRMVCDNLYDNWPGTKEHDPTKKFNWELIFTPDLRKAVSSYAGECYYENGGKCNAQLTEKRNGDRDDLPDCEHCERGAGFTSSKFKDCGSLPEHKFDWEKRTLRGAKPWTGPEPVDPWVAACEKAGGYGHQDAAGNLDYCCKASCGSKCAVGGCSDKKIGGSSNCCGSGIYNKGKGTVCSMSGDKLAKVPCLSQAAMTARKGGAGAEEDVTEAEQGLGAGAVAGIVVGCVVGAVGLVVLGVVIERRRQQTRGAGSDPKTLVDAKYDNMAAEEEEQL